MSDLSLPASIRKEWLDADRKLPALRVHNPHCSALFSLQGAQLLSFQPHGKAPLLWLSDQALYIPGKAIRGGIPLCFPWFGPHPEDARKPAHGFARQKEWQLLEASDTPEGSWLVFGLSDDAASRQLWPHAFAATLAFLLADTLTVTLGVRNTDSRDFHFGFALHSYFPTTDIRQTLVDGLEDCAFIDQLKGDALFPAESAAIRFSSETDRIYEGASGRYRIRDEAEQQGIVLNAPGCHSAIVWNPWAEKTARLADMSAQGWQQMLCVECGNTGRDGITLRPGEKREFSLQISDD